MDQAQKASLWMAHRVVHLTFKILNLPFSNNGWQWRGPQWLDDSPVKSGFSSISDPEVRMQGEAFSGKIFAPSPKVERKKGKKWVDSELIRIQLCQATHLCYPPNLNFSCNCNGKMSWCRENDSKFQLCHAKHMCHPPNLNFVAIDPDYGCKEVKKRCDQNWK